MYCRVLFTRMHIMILYFDFVLEMICLQLQKGNDIYIDIYIVQGETTSDCPLLSIMQLKGENMIRVLFDERTRWRFMRKHR